MVMTRDVVIEQVEKFFEGKEYEKFFVFNVRGEITEDASSGKSEVNDVQDFAVVYIEKLPTAYVPNVFNLKLEDEYTIGIRTSYPHSKINLETGEKIIYEMWRYFNVLDTCKGFKMEVVNNYTILAKDAKERYYMEFNIKIKN